MSAEGFPALLVALAGQRRVRTVGLTGAARAWTLARLHEELEAPLVCVTVYEESADALAGDLAFFLGGEGDRLTPNVVRLPADEVLPWDELVPDQGVVAERLGALFHLGRGTAFPALVLSARALVKRVLPPAVLQALSGVVHLEEEVGRDALARRLVEIGYRNAPLVEDAGTFSLRGDILDVFPALHEHPVRLEFFGDTVESMRSFDPGTQRTLDGLRSLTLLPARELFFSPATKRAAEGAIKAAAELQHVPSSRVRERLEQVREGISAAGLEGLLPGFFPGGLATVFDYLGVWHPAPLLWLDEPAALDRTLAELSLDLERSHADAVRRLELTLPPDAHFLGRDALALRLQGHRVVEGGGLSLDTGAEAPVRFEFAGTHALREAIRSHHGEEGALAPLLARLEGWRDEGTTTLVACGSAGQADRLQRLLGDRGVRTATHPAPFDGTVPPPQSKVLAHLFVGEVSAGFVDGPARLAVLSDQDIFGPRARRRARKRRGAEGFAAGFQDLEEGGLCVHADFGLCRYAGLLTMEVQGVSGDFLTLEFAGKDKVYLPVSRMRLISRFTGGDPSKVALDKLGSNSFERRKALVKEQLLKMAADLLQLYAQRKAHPGHPFSAPDRYYRQFEADFEFEETPDQQRAIDDVLADMQKPEPMDRLVCGDVGYGKTEVAMRAVFKAVLDRKQVAILVPTTLLAHQHLASLRRRFDGYPVTVEVISSLRKQADVREVLRRAREGRVDVVVGTHKLLNAEVGFKDLGLLVIDEEQKFGVKQKESLKRLKTTVDTLTLTATPIPRTLNMAMSGMRDLSLIATPPQDRKAIRTFVNKFDEQQIKEAITREIQRGGQVFFVHNRVQSIHSMERFLKELVPGVSLVVGHGQMHEGQLERVMLDFVERRAQVLLATTIIESGLDISSANTMIVNRADQFGLSQLYQLRGRVGRSAERAYAYLLVPHGRAVTRDAERRLEVLQAFTELGAGFNIASHDLEIRGAGNLLGKEQSGSIEAVGFDLYAQMLEDAIAEVKGEAPRDVVEPDVNLPVAAFLPEAYVPDVHQRLVLYKRFSNAASAEDLADLRAELIDRFGDAPDEVDALQEVMLLKIDLRRLQLRQLDGGPGRLVATLGGEARLDPGKVAALVQRSQGVYRLTPDMKLVARLDAGVTGLEFIPAARKVVRDLLACAG
jgi:transcription-repair coupling factor (superfamily II helicase)